MNYPRRNISSSITLLFAAYLVLPICIPYLASSVYAQKPVGIPMTPPITTTKVDLGNSKHKIVFRNKDGKVFMEHEYTFGVLTKTKIILEEYPNGQEARVVVVTNDTRGGKVYPRSETTKYDKRGKPLERETYRLGPKGKYITIKEKRVGNKWVPVPKSKQSSQSSKGYNSSSTVVNGLQTTTFETPKGEIVFNVTDDISAGSSLSGTVYVKPDGPDEEERRINADELGEYTVAIGDQEAKTSSRKFDQFKWTLPDSAAGIASLVLKDKKGKEVARTGLLVYRVPFEAISQNQLPEIGQQGESITTKGKFDGDFSNTDVKIGDDPSPVIAESSSKLVTYNGGKTLGVTSIEVNEGGQIAKGEFRNVGIQLSAPKLDLMRGEQTILTVKVFGLAGIENPVPLLIENKSVTVIILGGGNTQQIMISPAQVENGTFTIQRPLTGITRGSFTITGTVVVEAEQNKVQVLF